MLDVHPAHHAANTWRDFFIHIATIVLGLLIAIGLEQTVEAVHHHQQRVRLEEDMRAEAEQNVRIMDNDFAKDLPDLAWQSLAMRTVRDAPVAGGYITVTLPSEADVAPLYTISGNEQSTVPSHSVWTVALATGQVALLPLAQAKIYDRLDREATEYIHIDSLADVETHEYLAALRNLNVYFVPKEAIHLTAPQRDELVRAVNIHAQMIYWDEMRLSFWKGASLAVLHNVQTPDEVFPYMAKENAAIPKP